MDRITAFAPATVANIGPCFDRAGFAVAAPNDTVTVAWNDKGKIEVIEITGDGGKLPKDVNKNTAAVAAREVLKLAGEKRGVDIWLNKDMPLYSGLGSSAASGAAAAVAVNQLLGEKFTKDELLPACLSAEEAACGARHADNAAPSLLGGLILIEDGVVHQHKLPFELNVILVTPDVAVPTAASRAALAPVREIIEHDAIEKLTRLKKATTLADFSAVVRDNNLLESVRGPLIPGFPEAQAAALKAGALAATISGSGPTLFAIAENAASAEKIRNSVVEIWRSLELATHTWITELDPLGARIIA